MLRKIVSSVINQFLPPQVFKTTLNDLPAHLIEEIFSYLNYDEIMNMKVFSNYVNSIAINYIKDGIIRCKNDLQKQLDVTYLVLTTKETTLTDKIRAIALYNIYKILESEISTIHAMNRCILENKNEYFPIGSLLDLFYTILKKTFNNKCNANEIHKEHSEQFYNEVKKFLLDLEKNSYSSFDIIPLGVQAVDLVDLLLDVEYESTIIYRVFENICQIRAVYTVNRAKLLNYFPQLPKSCNNRQITEDESKAIMKYLSILLQVHNRLNIEEDFGWIQLVDPKAEQDRFLHEVRKTTSKIKRKYIENRIHCSREILDSKKCIVKENYVNEKSNKLDSNDQGIVVKVNLTCSLQNAPMKVKQSFQLLKGDIERKHRSVKMINPKVFETPHPRECEGVYSLALYMKIWYSEKLKNECPKDTVELYFVDGNALTNRYKRCHN